MKKDVAECKRATGKDELDYEIAYDKYNANDWK
jgi:hypothetical protein